MMQCEFEELTGIYLTIDHYRAVEGVYVVDTTYANKQEFCQAYKENRDGLADRIARSVSISQMKSTRAHAETIKQAEDHAAELQAKVERLERELEREQEWKPYEMAQNVSRAEYEKLVKCGRVMTDEEAAQLVADEFGFQLSRIKIIRQVPTWEISRHNQLREVGEEERLPRYDATDWNYVRFDVNGWHYEMSNGSLRPFFC